MNTKNKNPYLFINGPFNKKSGGNQVIYKLCKEIENLGYETYIYPYPYYLKSYFVNSYNCKILNNKIDIIGVGGVDSGDTAYQKFIHGAKFVQLYTGMVFQGPKIVSKISDELNNILETNNVKKLSDIIGKI